MSREVLLSLGTELAALHTSIDDAAAATQATSDDVQRMFCNTEVVALILDSDLKVRYRTPESAGVLNVHPEDLGRPLSDINSFAAGHSILEDARAVLQGAATTQREFVVNGGVWYCVNVFGYQSVDKATAGVAIAFTNITAQKRIAQALEEAKQQAEQANAAKSWFLATASHDLRQPIQTLALLQGMLEKMVEGEKAQKLIALLGQTTGAMSGMLNTLLDINQIDAGTVHVEKVNFPISDVMDRLKEEFSYHAQAHGLEFRMVTCRHTIESDPRVLEQMLRNLLSNAFKYTTQGKVVLGCRRRKNTLSIEVWDTGIGIPTEQLERIFEEYHQVDKSGREQGRGLGLGLSIVQRLGEMLGHRVSVRSQAGRGSVFSIEVALTEGAATSGESSSPPQTEGKGTTEKHTGGSVLIIENDPALRKLLKLVFADEGYRAMMAADGAAALSLLRRNRVFPDLIIAEHNLSDGMTGLEIRAMIEDQLCRRVPIVILTGDVVAPALRNSLPHDCVQVKKPVKTGSLLQVVKQLISQSGVGSLNAVQMDYSYPHEAREYSSDSVVYIVDDDCFIRDSVRATLEAVGMTVEDYASCEDFLKVYSPAEADRESCLLIDAYLPGMKGLDLLQHLRDAGHSLPAIMITGSSDLAMAVEVMKAGALDVIQKPVNASVLLDCIARALDQSRTKAKASGWSVNAIHTLAKLTARQRQILDMILDGLPNKIIAAELGISQRTVENHRARIMKKAGVKSLPALARLAMAATASGTAA